MRWYQTIIKRILSGVIFLLVPLLLLVFILGKAIALVQLLILPIKQYLPDEPVLGVGLLNLISFIAVLLICYLAGTLAEKKRVKSIIARLEEKVLDFIPGYAFIKSWAADALDNTDDDMQSVFVDEGGDWKPGIEIEKHANGYSSVFFPGPPFGKSGLLKLVHGSRLKHLDIPVADLVKMVRKYGKGATCWLDKETLEESKSEAPLFPI